MTNAHVWYLIKRLETRLAENFQKVLHSSGYAKSVHLIARVDLLKLLDRTKKSIRAYMSKSYWVETDEFGSGYDTRYTHITWMDTV